MSTALATPEPPPYFTLQVGVGFCRCDIRVNDVPVLVDDLSGARVDMEIPLNPLVFTGDNTVSVRLSPPRGSPQGPDEDLRGPSSRCAVTLQRKPYGAEEPKTLLATIVYEPGGDPFAGSSPEGEAVSPLAVTGDPDAGFAAARTARLVTPFPEWRWVQAEKIAPGELVMAELLREHQRFWAALRARDVPELRSIMASNAREIQSAYYLPDLENAWRVIGIEALLRNPDAALKALPTDLALEVFAHGRLARLVDAHGNSPIGFDERDTGLDAFVDAWFCRGNGGLGWVMIR